MASEHTNNLGCLPTGTIRHIASFLSRTSRAIFAVGLANPPNNDAALNDSSSAIIGSQWDILDFGDINKDLAAKLSDDDIKNVLIFIDAASRVKRLKLTGCINITGSGLEPLRGSLAIEQIDLSLVGDHQSSILDPEPQISRDVVIPILHSIIEREGCALKHLQLPRSWRRERDTQPHITSILYEFITRYNQMLETGPGVRCVKCSDRHRNEHLPLIATWDTSQSHALMYYQIQDTCYECLNNYCTNISCSTEDGRCMLNICANCERKYCADCSAMKGPCDICCYQYCMECATFMDCTACGGGCTEQVCNFCVSDRRCSHCKRIAVCDIYICSMCGVGNCYDCLDHEGATIVHYCNCGDDALCNSCRMRECQEGNSDNCARCYKLIAPFLIEETKRQRIEIDALKDEIAQLKKQKNEGAED